MIFRHARVSNGLLWLPISAVMCIGCASNPLKKLVAPVANVAPERELRSEEAIAEFERHRDQAQFTAALTRWREGDLIECRMTLDEIIERNPEHTEARLLLAELLLVEKQPQTALQHVQNVLNLEPENPVAIHTAGLVQEALGNNSAALEQYKRATELEPDNEVFLLSYDVAVGAPPRQVDGRPVGQVAGRELGVDHSNESASPAAGREPWRALLDEAELALKRGDDDAGREAFDRAMRFSGDDPQIPISIGVLILRYNRPELAQEYLEPAVTRFPNDHRLHRTLGLALYRQGQYEASQVSLGQALSLDNTDALSYVLLGSVLSKLGDRAAAENYLLEAQRLDPSLTKIH